MAGFYFSNKNLNHDIISKKQEYLFFRGSNIKSNTIGKDITIISATYSNTILYTNENLTIICDGNIVNYDSYESLIELYKKYGKDMLLKLNGGFSFIIYDSEKQILFGARDRLGEKPFFYTINKNGIECSSSLKSICVGNKFEINPIAKTMYMNYGYIYDSCCIFKEVNKLQAGHYFIYDLKTNNIQIEKYWDIDGIGFYEYPKMNTAKEAIEYIDKLLEDAIKIRVKSLDKFGVAISSGTDGFIIYSYLNKLKYSPELYNIISCEKSPYNEYPDALEHVHIIDTNKQIKYKCLTNQDFIDGIENYFMYYEEPNSDFSDIITDSLFTLIKNNNVTAELSGIGSDDIFFAKPLYKSYMNKIKEYNNSYIDFGQYCRKKEKTIDFSNVFNDNDILSLQRYDIKTYLPNLLVKEDIASSHNGVTVINPFCDYRLVEFLNTLDVNVLYKNKEFKYLLKQLILNKFSIDFFNATKRGFFPNIDCIYSIDLIKNDIIHYLTRKNINKFLPEINYNRIKIFIEDYDTYYKDRTLLNIYFYIRMMLNYEINILNK